MMNDPVAAFISTVHDETLAECGEKKIIAEALDRHIGVELRDSNWQFILELVIRDGTLRFSQKGNPVNIKSMRFIDDNQVQVGTTLDNLIFFFTEGRPLKLGDMQIKALALIANSKRQGITQSEVAKLLEVDPRSFFHHLKSLLANDIITKMPVSHQRTFTYLLHLARFAPAEATTDAEVLPTEETFSTLDAQITPSALSIRQKIIDLLSQSPQKTLSSSELYRLVHADAKLVKVYRRNVNWLITNGFIESIVAEELGGVVGRVLKYKKPLTEVTKSTREEVDNNTSTRIPSFWAFSTGRSLERQIHDFIDASGAKGVTTTDIMIAFGIGRKLAYRICEKLASKKTFRNSDVIKVAEFHGKERRHRLFTKSGKERTGTAPIEPIPIWESNGVTRVARDSVNRSRRLKALVDLINEVNVIEVGKPLASSLQQKLQEKDFVMDIKTLKRLIHQLESESLVKSIIVALPNGINRTIVLRANLSFEDPLVKNYIETIRKSKVELLVIDGEEQEPVAVTSKIMETSQAKRDHKYKMQKQGFVFGIMARCRILHGYLLNCIRSSSSSTGLESEWIIETLPCLFKRLPLGIFLAIIGLAEMSEELTNFISNLTLEQKILPLELLSSGFRKEIHRRRIAAHKVILKKLLENLTLLGLVASDHRFPSIGFRIPYQYRISKVATILDAEARPLETLDLHSEANFNHYWDWLESFSLTGVPAVDSLSTVYYEAANPINWRAAAPQKKALRRTLREMVKDWERDSSIPASLDEEQLARLREEFLVDNDYIQNALEDVLDEVEERRARITELRRRKRQRALESKSTRPLLPRSVDERPVLETIEDEELLATVPFKSFSEEDLYLFRLLYVILHWSRFLWQGHVNWQMALRLGEGNEFLILKKLTSEELRRVMMRIENTYDQIKLIWDLESDISVIKVASQYGIVNSEPDSVYDDEGELDRQSFFEQMVHYYHYNLKSVPELRKSLASHPEIDLNAYRESSVIKELPWYKFTRLQQLQYFQDLSLDLNNTLIQEYDFDGLAREVNMLRVYLFSLTPDEYDTESIKANLADIDETRMQAALKILERDGLISRKEVAGFVPRQPRSNFYINEEFVNIIDGRLQWPQISSTDDLASVLERISFDYSSLELLVHEGGMEIKEELDRKPRNATEKQLDEAIALHCSSALSREQIWSAPLDEIRPTILKAACNKIVTMLLAYPWLSLKSLRQQCWPILSESEIDDCLLILRIAKLIDMPKNLTPDETEIVLVNF